MRARRPLPSRTTRPYARRIGRLERRAPSRPRARGGASRRAPRSSSGGQQRHVARAARARRRSTPSSAVARGANGVARAERLVLHRDLDAVEAVARVAATRRRRPARRRRRAPRAITQSTMRRPSSGCRCFGVAERIRVPSPAAMTTAARSFGHERQDGWGARIRTWDRGTKTRCLTTWLRPRDRRKV